MTSQVECARPGCDVAFTKNKHNQKYCSPECCRIATNANIMKKYYETRDRKRGVARNCSVCGSRLSRYNPSSECQKCAVNASGNSAREVIEYLSNI